MPDFEKATGIKIEYTEDINDNAEFFAKIDEPLKRNQSIDRDIIVLTDWMAGRLISLGYAAPLDDAKFPNKANLVDNVKDVSFDPGRKYSVPWLSGMTGIGYNPKKTGRELTSINDIFDPKFKGQVTMLTEMRDTIGLVMLAMGKDPAKATQADAKAAAAKIKKARESGQIRKFTGNDYAEDLAAGNIAIAFAWSGDIQGLARGQPGPAVDRAQGRGHALLRQHADPQDLGPAGPGAWRGSTTSTIRSTRPRSWPARPTSRRSRAPARSWPRSRPTWPAARWSIRPTNCAPGCTSSGR